MLNEVNDGVEQALELARIAQEYRDCLISTWFRTILSVSTTNRESEQRVKAFYDTLKKNMVLTVVRQEHGTDIDAAYGQLRSTTMKRDREKGIVEHAQP